MRWLLVPLAAIVGFAVIFATTAFIGLSGTVRAECDGPCLEQWDEVLYISLGIGALGASLAGLAAFVALRRRVC